MFVTAVERLGLAFVHHDRLAVFRIKNPRAILEVVSDKQIHMTVPIEVSLGGGSGVPSLMVVRKLGWHIFRRCQRRGG